MEKTIKKMLQYGYSSLDKRDFDKTHSQTMKEYLIKVENQKLMGFITGSKIFKQEPTIEFAQELVESFGCLLPFDQIEFLLKSDSESFKQLQSFIHHAKQERDDLISYLFSIEDLDLIDKMLKYRVGSQYLDEEFFEKKKGFKTALSQDQICIDSPNRNVVVKNYPEAFEVRDLMHLHGKYEAQHGEKHPAFEKHFESAYIGEYGQLYQYLYWSGEFSHEKVNEEVCKIWFDEGKEQTPSM